LGRGFPGLKPRAESSRPLWGEELSQILLILVPFNPWLKPRVNPGYAFLAAPGRMIEANTYR
jgi:hypothetical protein